MRPKIQILKKLFLEILKSQKIHLPKKMTPKSHAKNKSLFLQHPFLAIF